MTSCQLPSVKNISPCPYFFDCGGCDFLDLTEENYQKLKQQNSLEIVDALASKNGVEIDWIWVDPHSRRRINLQVGKKNELGFFGKKSNRIIEIEKCFVAEAEISALILPLKNFLKNQEQNLFTQVSVTLFDNGLDLIFGAQKELNFTQTQKIITFAKENNLNISYRVKNHMAPIFQARKNQIFYQDFKINLDSDTFIQATKSGLYSITKIIRDFLAENKNIKNVADIYAGFGAYSFAIQDLVKSVSAFEGDEKMVGSISKNAAANNLSYKIKAEIYDLFATPLSKRDLKHFDLAIINPPRNGASPQVSEISKSELKNVIYVSCNPSSFSRDAKILIDSGFKIKKLTALDQFYSTKHLELIAIFTK
jgi:23S rRNA (uracil1939-C5)-methyltransferase